MENMDRKWRERIEIPTEYMKHGGCASIVGPGPGLRLGIVGRLISYR